MKRNINLLKKASPILLSTFILTFSITNAKYYISNYGIAWNSHLTDFAILKDVFEITEKEKESENLWAPKNEEGKNNTHESFTTPSGGNIASNEDYYFINEEFITLGSSWGSSFNQLTDADLTNANIDDCLLDSLSSVEFNVKNLTDENILITFDVCYYVPKATDSDVSNLYFSLYNSYLYPNTDSTDLTDSNLLYGEIIVNPVDRISTDGTCFKSEDKWSWTGSYTQYTVNLEEPSSNEDYADILSARIGDSGKNGYKYDNIWYYVHKTQINPYGIISSNSDIFKNNNLIDSFIVKPNQFYSFNLSIFYGAFDEDTTDTNLNNYPASFFSGVKIVARKVYNNVDFCSSDGTILKTIKLSEGSFLNNYGIQMYNTSPVTYGYSTRDFTEFTTDWQYYTLSDGTIVEKGTEGAVANEFTYFTKVTQDMKVYSKM